MIWKILFWIQLIIILGSSVINNIKLYMMPYGIGELDYILSFLLIPIILFMLVFLYSMGWKKQFLPKIITKWTLGLFFGYFIFYSGLVTYLVVQNPPVEVMMLPDSAQRVFGVFAFLTSLIIPVLKYLPAIIASFFYLKKSDDFEQISKPWWKMFTAFIIYNFVCALIMIFLNYRATVQFNIVDFADIFASLYFCILLAGYCLEKTCLPKLFWQISGVIASIILVATEFLPNSEIYMAVLNIDKNLGLISCSVVTFLLIALMIYAFVRYAFTQDVYKEEIAEKQEIQ